MAKIKVAINGFGRIGRNVFKIALERPELEVEGVLRPSKVNSPWLG